MGFQVEWEFFRAHLPSGWRELAIERGLIRPLPPQLKTKITDIEPVLQLILHRAGLETSLTSTAGEAAAAGLIQLSSVAVHKWERKLAPYLAELTAKLSDAPTLFSPGRWAGYDLLLVDATAVTRPGAEGTTARVHYVLRLADLRVLRSLVTDEHVGETLRNHTDLAHADQLWIGDRIHANPPGIATLVDAGAAVLVRYNRGALPLYDDKAQPFDVLSHVRTLCAPGGIEEWHVWVRPEGGAPIRGRLCAQRLPDDKIKEARARLRREQGSDVTAETLEAAAWVLVFTTVPRARMKTRRVLELYRLRWQVELEIKREKSIGGLSHLPNYREDTIATWLQAKLLIHQIAWTIASSAEVVPPSAAGWHVLADDEHRPPRPSSARTAHRQRGVARDDAPLRGHPRRTGFRPAA